MDTESAGAGRRRRDYKMRRAGHASAVPSDLAAHPSPQLLPSRRGRLTSHCCTRRPARPLLLLLPWPTPSSLSTPSRCLRLLPFSRLYPETRLPPSSTRRPRIQTRSPSTRQMELRRLPRATYCLRLRWQRLHKTSQRRLTRHQLLPRQMSSSTASMALTATTIIRLQPLPQTTVQST